MELSELQKKIVNASEDHIIVLAAAAAGKTAVLTERARKLLRDGVNPSDIAVITFTNLAAQELRDRLADDYKDGIYIGTIHGLANKFLLSHGISTGKLIEEEEFDEFFTLLQKNPSCVKHIPIILLDEAQDSSWEEFNFIFNMIQPDQFFVCGDIRQCQPVGTKITLWNKTEKNIEDIKIGDKVISYNISQGRVYGGTAHNAYNASVIGIDSHFIKNEHLIKVYTKDGHTTTYTYNHRAIANLCRFDEYNYLTYLMCDSNNRFRVGTSQFRNSNTGPWRAKMLAENCDKIWILQTFKTNKEARVLEDKISYKYSIPQITFQLDKTTYTQQDIDYIYDGLDTKTSAEQCLKDFNRDIAYPFAQKNDNIHYASNAYNEVQACNLLPHNMQLLLYDPKDKHRKKPVDIDRIEYVDGNNILVYSLNIEQMHTYVADGIFTHNSIYGFRGAQPQLLAELAKDSGATLYDLNENYRNGANILSYAKRILARDGMRDTSVAMRPGGTVYEGPCDVENIVKWIQRHGSFKDWAILCSTNDEIKWLMGKLDEYSIPTITFKQGKMTKKQLETAMKDNVVKVLTRHSAKGLEFPYVIVYNPSWWGNEARRVNYVAATRARDVLMWLEPQKKKKPKFFGTD